MDFCANSWYSKIGNRRIGYNGDGNLTDNMEDGKVEELDYSNTNIHHIISAML